ncbi:MAG: glycosyl hydrolase, partial [Verrucomicrobiota bacterium]|nr:glycosyl hydrolase [Verrucomicrobiota bacterium]
MKSIHRNKYLTFIFTISLLTNLSSQNKKNDIWADDNFTGLKFRSIGPALMAGRISDIAIHPEDDNIWYLTVGSGGVWKTTNAGVTWTPIFDDQGSYSIGCVTIDPNNPHIVWIGTGEDLGGRHFGYGDGVYRSDDGGKTWKNMGLKNSEHVSKILIHPENSNVVWVASQGPLWSKGGDRGVYKSTDGGKNWNQVWSDNEWTGATELVMDPRSPDRLYLASWQRHRNIAAYMGGGPGSGIHRSDDGGKTWQKLSSGLPKSNMGKIGLDISQHNPDVLYAAIELDRRKGGVYRTTNPGSTWKKMSDTVSGATGPHYYQELYASPHKFDRLYLMDANMQISENGGKTFYRMSEQHKHGDNHAIAFRKDDPDYLLVGSDGGLYESFDHTKTWRFMANLP